MIGDNFVNDKSRPILIFTNEAAVQPHAKFAFSVGHMLQSLGYRVLVARCTGILNRCPVMDMHKMPFTDFATPQRNACGSCLGIACQLHAAYGLEAVDLASVCDDTILVGIKEALDSAPKDLNQFEYHGINFGRLSAIDFSLATKADDRFELSQEQRTAWLSYIGSAMLSYQLAGRLIDLHHVGALFYFGDYGINLAARFAAEQRGISACVLNMPSHRIIDRTKAIFSRDTWHKLRQGLLTSFEAFQDVSIPAHEIREIVEDSMLRFRGSGSHSHVYSPAKTVNTSSVLNSLRLDPTRKIVVAFTSSMDEYAASIKTFEASGERIDLEHTFPVLNDSIQIGWLAQLVNYFKHREDLQLVIRVHPREGVTHREAVSSAHLPLLRKHFCEVPANCRVIWPEEKVSSYDLAEIADLVLTSWTTMGLECARLGIPVLACHKGMTVSGYDFLEYGESPEDYFTKFESLLSRKPSVQILLRAFRCHAHYHLRSSIDIKDVIVLDDPEKTPLPLLSKNAGIFEAVLMGNENVCDLSYKALREQQGAAFSEMERQALAEGIRALIDFLMTGQVGGSLPELQIRHSAGDFGSVVSSDCRPGVLIIEGEMVHYVAGQGLVSRYSPLVCRLAVLLEQLQGYSHLPKSEALGACQPAVTL